MKVFLFSGSFQIEVVIAESEEQAWDFLTTHDGTASNGGTLEYLKSHWEVEKVFDPATMTEPACAGHYSG